MAPTTSIPRSDWPRRWLKKYGGHHLTLILGIADDKDVEQMVQVLAPMANRIIATSSHHPRAAKAERIVRRWRNLIRRCRRSSSRRMCRRAVRNALSSAGQADVICATGSLYVVAETREASGTGKVGRIRASATLSLAIVNGANPRIKRRAHAIPLDLQ